MAFFPHVNVIYIRHIYPVVAFSVKTKRQFLVSGLIAGLFMCQDEDETENESFCLYKKMLVTNEPRP